MWGAVVMAGPNRGQFRGGITSPDLPRVWPCHRPAGVPKLRVMGWVRDPKPTSSCGCCSSWRGGGGGVSWGVTDREGMWGPGRGWLRSGGL